MLLALKSYKIKKKEPHKKLFPWFLNFPQDSHSFATRSLIQCIEKWLNFTWKAPDDGQ